MRIVQLLSLGIACSLFCAGMPYSAWAARTGSHSLSTNDAIFERLIDQQLRTQSRFQAGLPAPGSVRILRTLVLAYGAAVIGTYPLRPTQRGCSGTLRMTAFKAGTHWRTGGFETNKTCLSTRVPLEFVWSRSFWGTKTLLVLSGRALSGVASIEIIRERSRAAVTLQNGAFVVEGSHEGIRLVQALDAHGRVLYQTKLVGH